MRVSLSQKNLTIIQDRLAFSVLRLNPRNDEEFFYFSVDKNQEFLPMKMNAYCGPPSLLQIYKFDKIMEDLIKQRSEKVNFFTKADFPYKSCSALYISAFRMLHLRLSPEDAYAPIRLLTSQFKPFRDMSPSESFFDLTILDCLRAIWKAESKGLFSISTFDPSIYEKLQQKMAGNMNWIVPGKLLAMATPYSKDPQPSGARVPTPVVFIPALKSLKITHIIRLNQCFYDASVFTEAGFKHTELFFEGDSAPKPKIVEQFLSIMSSDDTIAVHCSAGLGRTGTLCCCYLIKEFDFTGQEAIAWLRICRPGSVYEKQQLFVLSFANDMRREEIVATARIDTSERVERDRYQAGPKHTRTQVMSARLPKKDQNLLIRSMSIRRK